MLSLSCALDLLKRHTHTHTHTRTRARTHAHTRTRGSRAAAAVAYTGVTTTAPSTAGFWYCAVRAHRGSNSIVLKATLSLSEAQRVLGMGDGNRQQAIIPMSGTAAGDPTKLAKTWSGGSMWWGGWGAINNMQSKCAAYPPPPGAMSATRPAQPRRVATVGATSSASLTANQYTRVGGGNWGGTYGGVAWWVRQTTLRACGFLGKLHGWHREAHRIRTAVSGAARSWCVVRPKKTLTVGCVGCHPPTNLAMRATGCRRMHVPRRAEVHGVGQSQLVCLVKLRRRCVLHCISSTPARG